VGSNFSISISIAFHSSKAMRKSPSGTTARPRTLAGRVADERRLAVKTRLPYGGDAGEMSSVESEEPPLRQQSTQRRAVSRLQQTQKGQQLEARQLQKRPSAQAPVRNRQQQDLQKPRQTFRATAAKTATAKKPPPPHQAGERKVENEEEEEEGESEVDVEEPQHEEPVQDMLSDEEEGGEEETRPAVAATSVKKRLMAKKVRRTRTLPSSSSSSNSDSSKSSSTSESDSSSTISSSSTETSSLFSSSSDSESDSSFSSSSNSSESTLDSDDSQYSAKLRKRKRRKRRKRNQSPLLKNLSRFLPPIFALPIYLIIKVFILWPWSFLWGFSKRGALLIMIIQPYAERVFLFIRSNFPWSRLRAGLVVALKLTRATFSLGGSASKEATLVLWDSSQSWGQRTVILGKAAGSLILALMAKSGALLVDVVLWAIRSCRSATIYILQAMLNILWNILVLPITIGRTIVFFPYTAFDAARNFSKFFKKNQEAFADVIATIIGMYFLGIIFGVMLGPPAVKLGILKFDTLDALGLGELCVSLGLLRRPGWLIWS